MFVNIKSVLIANRGEIALRLVRACQELGLKSIVAYSEADKESLAVKLADSSICIGPSPVQLSYQNHEAILSAAISLKIDAIHPGYGFLSENAIFAQKCEEQGIRFIGSPSQIIKKMGNKIEARKTAFNAKVPIIPGSKGKINNFDEALSISKEIGYPLLIKAAAGGGGRGMRVVLKETELENSLNEIMSESEIIFGDPSIYIERYLSDIRHIEVQILSDGKEFLHLGERECSLQRRNQKLIEEAPSFILTDEERHNICSSAVRFCREAQFYGVGTVEYVFDNINREFYFIEMNTRIQVEHTITEEITGVDIAKEQIKIAEGIPIGFKQEDIIFRGHAIECRLNAEDSQNNFIPSPGKVVQYRASGGLGIRLESHLESGYIIPPFYDSMIGKLICWGMNRDEAIARMLRALKEIRIDGIKTTINLHQDIIGSNAFRKSEINTNFITNWLDNN